MRIRPHRPAAEPFWSCSVCADQATGIRHDAQIIASCHDCATDILPTLIADATIGRIDPRTMDRAKHTWDRCTIAFYRAVATEILRQHVGGRG